MSTFPAIRAALADEANPHRVIEAIDRTVGIYEDELGIAVDYINEHAGIKLSRDPEWLQRQQYCAWKIGLMHENKEGRRWDSFWLDGCPDVVLYLFACEALQRVLDKSPKAYPWYIINEASADLVQLGRWAKGQGSKPSAEPLKKNLRLTMSARRFDFLKSVEACLTHGPYDAARHAAKGCRGWLTHGRSARAVTHQDCDEILFEILVELLEQFAKGELPNR